MKRLLRGIIDWGNIPLESLASNFQRLRSSRIQWVQPADKRIFTFVTDFFGRELSLPSARVIHDYFRKTDDLEVIERLKDVKEAPPYEGANYSFILKDLVEEQGRIELLTILKETQEVAQKGLLIGEGRNKERIEGVKDAVNHFQRKASELIQADSNTKTRGDLRDAAKEARKDYELAKANPGQAVGKYMGIDPIDNVCKGLKKGELWVHAAFTGELKSTVAINWCYNLVTRYRTNIFYISLEMPFKQIRNIVCVLHSAHGKWKRMGKDPLDYRKVRDGELSEEEEEFYYQVLEDFETNEDYCHFEVLCPDHDMNMADIKMEAELMHKQMDVGFLVVDHGGITQPIEKHRDFNIALNSVLRDAKKLALQFNQGEGLPVLLLFQLNRQGKDDADKSEGRYKLRSLSHANEAERSADVVTTTYLNDKLRKIGTTVFCCLKNRDNPFFDPFEAAVDFKCRKIMTLAAGGETVFNYNNTLEAEDAMEEEDQDVLAVLA